jgi:uncharacterized membrane protein SpoIIM required for sporulation
MTRDELLRERGLAWQRLETLLGRTTLVGSAGDRMRSFTSTPLEPAEMREVSDLYRSLAGDLMRVRRDKLGGDLERHLDTLASRAHNLIYSRSQRVQRLNIAGLALDFPGAVRRNGRLFGIAFLLFFGPLIIAGFAAFADETYAIAVLDEAQLQQMEEMYRAARPQGRDANTDATMTGFYVWNNVGIAFRCFATGLLFGLGPIFYLLFNGLSIGIAFGHLARVGLGENIFSFVASHSAWELVAIVIAGGAGLQMGLAMVKTRGRTRLGNLQGHRLELLRQVLGASMFLLIAALIEGNFSPSGLPPIVKYTAGVWGWALVAAILLLGGRDRDLPPDVVRLREQDGTHG